MLKRLTFLCLPITLSAVASTEVCDFPCDVDVSFLQTDLNVLARSPPSHREDRHSELLEQRVGANVAVVEDHPLQSSQASLESRQNIGQRHRQPSKQLQIGQPSDSQPFSFFQTDSVQQHSSGETDSGVHRSSRDAQAVTDQVTNQALTLQVDFDWVLPTAFVGTVLCSMWLSKSLYKRWAVADGGAKGIELVPALEVDKVSATMLAPDEDAQPVAWNARFFETPVREAFGLSVDLLPTEGTSL